MLNDRPWLPLSVQTRFANFRFESTEPGPDGITAVRLQINSYNTYAILLLPIGDLLVFADLIYRMMAQRPRDIPTEQQTVRVELVAAAPSAPPIEELAPTPLERRSRPVRTSTKSQPSGSVWRQDDEDAVSKGLVRELLVDGLHRRLPARQRPRRSAASGTSR